jgi:alkanesulfonate monooxygenase SsuD/methylene tetrahydromethanopterin reductase-like flavin-dependent oxidoreductase (luciferase family)
MPSLRRSGNVSRNCTKRTLDGRSDAAIRRAGKLGDGWLGIWNSPRRFPAAAEMAARAARPDPPRRHAIQVWCALADSRPTARACLAPAMGAFYQLPFERFERYCPCGTADDVAEFLTPYLAAGCTEFNLIPQSPDPGQAIAGTAAVKRPRGPEAPRPRERP